MIEIDATGLIAGLILAALGGGGLVSFLYWLLKRLIVAKDDALSTTLKALNKKDEELKTRDDEQGLRLHKIETQFVPRQEIQQMLDRETSWLSQQVHEISKEFSTFKANLAKANAEIELILKKEPT